MNIKTYLCVLKLTKIYELSVQPSTRNLYKNVGNYNYTANSKSG